MCGVDLTRIDGIDVTTALVVISETGVDMSRNWLRVSIRIGVAFLKENEGLGEWGAAKRAMR